MIPIKSPSKLTLIAGLRYDFFERGESRGRFSAFIPPGLGDGAPATEENLRCPQAKFWASYRACVGPPVRLIPGRQT